MFEGVGCAERQPQVDPPDFDVDVLLARDPSARRYFEDHPADWAPDPVWLAELDAMPPERPERIWLEGRPATA